MLARGVHVLPMVRSARARVLAVLVRAPPKRHVRICPSTRSRRTLGQRTDASTDIWQRLRDASQ